MISAGSSDRRLCASDSDDESIPNYATIMGRLPDTASLPSLSASVEPATTRRPREKLASVLKASERLLRKTLPDLPRPDAPFRKLDSFIMSLKEDRLRKHTIKEASHPQPSRLHSLFPPGTLGRRPTLSADNSPLDMMEIVVGSQTEEPHSTSRSVQMVRKSIAPKLKRASIAKLNEDLDVRIQQQLDLDKDKGRREKTRKDALAQECKERLQKEWNVDDEFGISEEDDAVKEDPGMFEQQDLEPRILAKATRIESDEEDPMDGLPPTLKTYSRSKTRPQLKSDSEQDDALDTLLAPEHPVTIRLEDGLTQLLSGQFPSLSETQETDEEELEADLVSDTTEDSKLGDFKYGVDRNHSREYEFNEGGYSAKNLIEEEAEDEDSDVSADDIDEEAIAKELRESAFLNDEMDEDESQANPSDQLAIHRQLLEEQDVEEMEMFMNRFVPDEVLRKTGVYAELCTKYADNDDMAAETAGKAKKSSSDGTSVGVSAFGKVKGHAIAPTRSHPEFLKLLEQDRLSSETEPETELTTASEPSDDGEGEGDGDGDGMLTDGPRDSLLFTSSVIHHHSALVIGKRMRFSINDELLKVRLTSTMKEKEDSAPVDSKRTRTTTFETVSARPVIVKEKMGRK